MFGTNGGERKVDNLGRGNNGQAGRWGSSLVDELLDLVLVGYCVHLVLLSQRLTHLQICNVGRVSLRI